MAGNAKCELSSGGSPEDSGFAGVYSNGLRGTHPIASLDRLGSFRENSNGRASISGASMPKGKAVDLPPLSQSLVLEPVTLGDQKCSRSGELRRALSFSFGSISEDNSFGAAHSKPAPALAIDELKRFRGSVQDSNDKSRSRIKKMEDSLNKLTTYLRKQQINERSSGSNLLKTGTQLYRKSPDAMAQKMDDRGKNVLNRRARTPVPDNRAEGRGAGIPRPHMVLGKDKDVTKQGSLIPESVEEKIRRLPAGGESWDRKMKRKRSMNNVFPRPIDGDGEIKRAAVHGRPNSDSGLPSSDAPPFRSGSSGGVGGNMKLDASSGPSVRPTPKTEFEKVSVSRELGGMNKERVLHKGGNKLNMRDENHVVNPSLMTKGKASRVSRAGPPLAGNSSPTFSRGVSTLEDLEQPSNASKIHSLGGINNRKRAFQSDSSSPPMAQWVGQRPQKLSRIRRTNITSPASNNEEIPVSSEGYAASDFGGLTSGGFNGSFPTRTNNSLPLRANSENTPSPARLSETEETGAVDNKSKDRSIGSMNLEERGLNGYQHAGSPGLLTKKSRLLAKEEIGDGVRRQGRSGRGSSFSRGRSMSPVGEKIESPAALASKPVRSAKPGSDKNGSKSGRPPLKKHSERKGFTRLGLVPNGNSPDCTAESDDDREDLLAAAQFACSAKYLSCSSPFWKNMEPLFSIRDSEKSYLIEQLKSSEENQEGPSQFFPTGDALKEENHPRGSLGPEGEKLSMSRTDLAETEGLINRSQGGLSTGKASEGGPKDSTPLYQRVLSALIVEDDFEEFERNNCGGNSSFFSDGDMACSVEEKIFCNGDTPYNRCSSLDIPFQLDPWEGDFNFISFEAGVSSRSILNGSLTSHNSMPGDHSSRGQYAQMSIDEKVLLELQSIGIYPENVPDLAEGEDDIFSKEILLLKKQFSLEAEKKNSCLERLGKAVKEEKDLVERDLEQVAMNRLIVLAYRKLLATRGSSAARMGVSKVPRHVALAFARRTLARSRKFEDTGRSCFSEPALREALLAAPPSSDNAETIKSACLTGNNMQTKGKAPGLYSNGTERPGLHQNNPASTLVDSDRPFAKDGPALNRGKKKEVLLDDVGDGPTFKPPPLSNGLMGGVKGKRSERDRGKDLSSRNASAKPGRSPVTNIRGERRAKSKPKQRAAQLSAHPVFPSPPSNNHGSSKNSKDPIEPTDEPMHELDPVVELGVDSAFVENQDLSSWLNFDEDNLQDHDSMGLEIPMDDLSDLNMLI